jgi:hypothetical protein
MHGQGALTWKNGRKYVGSFNKEREHGFGTFQFADGRKYEGYWVKGK